MSNPEYPRKIRSTAFRVTVRVIIGLIIIAGIVVLVMIAPLAWDQTVGSPG